MIVYWKNGDMTSDRPFAPMIRRLRAAGLRSTRQRLALGRLLFDAGDRHVSAEDLHGEAVAAGIPVSLATVYNTLHQFTAAGLLKEVIVDSARSYFDTNMRDHSHFYLEGSGELVDIPPEAVEVTGVPNPPAGHRIKRIDVIIRVADD
jgi:Fur family iron response transcriptional regulator